MKSTEKRIVSVNIKGTHFDYVQGSQKVFYKMIVEYEGESWQVMKRYSEFHDLNEQLMFHFSGVPSFPGKTLFKVKNPEQIEKRRGQLEMFIKLCCQREEFYANTKFTTFLEVDENAPDTLLNQITLVGRLTHPQFGYRDVIIEKKYDLIFVLTSQMSASAR